MDIITDMNRRELVDCFYDTMAMSESIMLRGKTEQAKRSTKVYKENFFSGRLADVNRKAQAEGSDGQYVTVTEGTTFATAKKFVGEGKIGVLNFANPHYPGGGVVNGAKAQEECLCRCSNLYPCLLTAEAGNEYYNYNKSNASTFFSDRIIYSDNVTVFKTDDAVPVLMPENEWFDVSVITCAAPYVADRKYTNKKALKELFKKRIRNIFEVAIDNNIDILILGAFGCGAFKNPPKVVASAFHEVINENRDRFGNFIGKIVFAIKSTVGDDSFEACPNLTAFESEFDGVSEGILGEYADCTSVDPMIKMPSGRIYYNFQPLIWQADNKYYGKQFSILGDSISTLDGFNPGGYNVFFKDENSKKANVNDMNDTWWGKVIDFFGGELLVNNSWSGSCVTKLRDRDMLFPSGCSDERTGGLHIDSVSPDVIIVYLGMNDWANAALCSAAADENDLSTGQYEYFSAAYRQMLRKLKENYPEAEIWCCTLGTTYFSSDPSFVFPEKYNGSYIAPYNEEIRKAVSQFDCRLIDLYSCKTPYDTIDGTHPNADGMNTLATLIIRAMADEKGADFLDCEDDNHDYQIVSETTGATKYICRKCGKIKMTYAIPEGNGANKEEPIRTNEAIYDAEFEYVRADSKSTQNLFGSDIRLFIVGDRKELRFDKNLITVGRTLEADITLNFPEASRNHARLYYENSSWFVADTGSVNGVWLNGVKLKPNTKYELFMNDEIDVAGREKIVFNKVESDTDLNTVIPAKEQKIELTEGMLLDGRYRLLRQIGQGSFAKIYLVADERLGKSWVLKVCEKTAASGAAVKSLITEMEMVKNLNHPAIPHIADMINNNDYLCIVEDYIAGGTLEWNVNQFGPRPQELVVEWAKQLCDVLGYLHSQNPPYIYRDVKPENVIIKPNGQLVLIDFGSMRTYKPNKSTDTSRLGTTGYAAPEQYANRQTDARTDIFGLGMTMHHLLTGIDPKTNQSPTLPIRRINGQLSVVLEQIVNKCIEIDPNNRYQSMWELRCALDNCFSVAQPVAFDGGSAAEKKADNLPYKKDVGQVCEPILFSAAKPVTAAADKEHIACPHCNKSISANANFCPYCGNKTKN